MGGMGEVVVFKLIRFARYILQYLNDHNNHIKLLTSNV